MNMLPLILLLAWLPMSFAWAQQETTCSEAMIAEAQRVQTGSDGSRKLSYQSAVEDIKDEISALEGARRDSAICIEYGIKFPELKRVWPSNEKQFELVWQDDLEEKTVQIFEQYLKYASDRSSFFDAAVPYPITVLIVLSGSTEKVEDSFATVAKLCAPSINQFGIGGFTVDGFVALCINDDVFRSDKLEYKNSALRSVLHEFFHAIQFQMAAPRRSRRSEDFLKDFGPAWLLEGAAEVFQDIKSYSCTEAGRQAITTLVSSTPINVGSYEEPWYDQQNSVDAYEISHLSVCYLLEGSSFQNIFDFYQNIGFGYEWADAFKRSFNEDYIYFISKVNSELNERLLDGDRIQLLPPD